MIRLYRRLRSWLAQDWFGLPPEEAGDLAPHVYLIPLLHRKREDRD